jgi:RimJ/RimL family protein N-acetyltransferase
MIISTARLIIRPWQIADLHAMAAWPRFPDPLDADWNWPHELNAQGMLELFFAIRSADPKRREWTILTKQDAVVGYVGLREIDQVDRSARLGIGFGYPYIGRGYGYEALCAFLETVFSTLQFRCIYLDVGMPNLRARRLYDRLGFRETYTFWRDVGSARGWTFLDDSHYDEVRHFFRWSAHNVYMLCAEMTLKAGDWRLETED